MEIPENPDFDYIQNLLKDDLRNDFLKFVFSDKDMNNENLKIIYQHFRHYNACIRKIAEVIDEKSDKIDLLEQALEFQSKHIEDIAHATKKQGAIVNKIMNFKFLGFSIFK